MILNFRKKNLLFYGSILLCVSVFAFLMFSAIWKIDSVATSSSASGLPKVIIDAGHGGEDGGATGIDGVSEKEINLSIAKNLESMLNLAGFQTIMTRDDDYDISDQGLKTVKQRKVSDLHNRLKLIEENKGCVFISIHQNKFSQSQYWGTQVFYSPNNDDSQILATNIKEAVTSFLQPENKRETKAADKNIYIIYNTKQPAVLVECGFLSNPSEVKKLKDEQYQKDMSFAIFSGFMNYWYGSKSTLS